MVTIEDAVIIGGRIIVTQFDAAPVHTIDIPSLSIVLTHTFTGIVCYPWGNIIIREVEEVGKTFFTSNETEDCGSSVGTDAVIQILGVFSNLHDADSLV